MEENDEKKKGTEMKISKQVFSSLQARLCLTFLSRVCHLHHPYTMFVIYNIFVSVLKKLSLLTTHIPLICQIITYEMYHISFFDDFLVYCCCCACIAFTASSQFPFANWMKLFLLQSFCDTYYISYKY